MVYSSYKKQQILHLHRQGHRPLAISRILQDEGMTASERSIAKFLKRYRETGTIARLPGSGRPSKITAEIKQIVDEQMRADDETTAYQLHAILNQRGYNVVTWLQR